MDPREQRTQTAITNAYLSLKARKKIEKITVSEICNLAKIHRSTFYAHYEDIYALATSIESMAVEDIFHAISDPSMILSDIDCFNKEFHEALGAYDTLLEILFSGSRINSLMDLIEERILRYIYEIHPEYRRDFTIGVKLNYLIHGGYHAYIRYQKTNPEQALAVISEVSAQILRDIQRGVGEIPKN